MNAPPASPAAGPGSFVQFSNPPVTTQPPPQSAPPPMPGTAGFANPGVVAAAPTPPANPAPPAVEHVDPAADAPDLSPPPQSQPTAQPPMQGVHKDPASPSNPLPGMQGGNLGMEVQDAGVAPGYDPSQSAPATSFSQAMAGFGQPKVTVGDQSSPMLAPDAKAATEPPAPAPSPQPPVQNSAPAPQATPNTPPGNFAEAMLAQAQAISQEPQPQPQPDPASSAPQVTVDPMPAMGVLAAISSQLETEKAKVAMALGIDALEHGNSQHYPPGSPVHEVIWYMRWGSQQMSEMPPQQLCHFERTLTAHQVFVQAQENHWASTFGLLGKEKDRIFRELRRNMTGGTEKDKDNDIIAGSAECRDLYVRLRVAEAMATYLRDMGQRFAQLQNGLKRSIDVRQAEHQTSLHQSGYQG